MAIDSVVLKWGVFPFPDDEDMNLVRGSQGPVNYFNRMSFSDKYDDRRLMFILNKLNWIFSLFWVLGSSFMAIISLIQGAFLVFKMLECISYVGEHFTDPEQIELFSTTNFISGPVFRWTGLKFFLTIAMNIVTLIPCLGFIISIYLW